MSLDLNAYGDCLACDGLVFLNDSDSFLTVMLVGSLVPARLHTACRATYEAEHGPVVCEDDERGETEDAAERAFDAKMERTINADNAPDDTAYRAEMINAGRGHLLT